MPPSNPRAGLPVRAGLLMLLVTQAMSVFSPSAGEDQPKSAFNIPSFQQNPSKAKELAAGQSFWLNEADLAKPSAKWRSFGEVEATETTREKERVKPKDNLEGQLSALKVRFAALEEEKAKSAEAARRATQESEGKLAAASAENGQLKERQAATNKKLEELFAQVGEFRAIFGKYSDLRRAYEASETQNKLLQVELDKARTGFAAGQDAQTKVVGLSKDLEDLGAKYNDLLAVNKAQAQKLTSVDQQAKDLEEFRAKYTDLLAVNKAQAQKLASADQQAKDLEDLRAKYTDLLAVNKAQAQKLDAAADQQTKAAGLFKELDELRAKHADQLAANKVLVQKLDASADEQAKAQAVFATEKAALLAQVEELKAGDARFNDLKARYVQVLRDFVAFKSEYQRFSAIYKAAKQENEGLKDQLTQLNQRLSESAGSCARSGSEWQDKHNQLKKDLEQRVAETDKLQQLVDDLKAAGAKAAKQSEQLQADLESCRGQTADAGKNADKIVQDCQSRFADLKASFEGLRQKYDSLSQSYDNLKQAFGKNSDVAKLYEESQAAQRELRTALDKTAADLANWEKRDKEAAEFSAGLRAKIDDLEREIKNVAASPDVLAALKTQLAELTEKLQRAEAALAQARTKPEEDPGLNRRVQDLDEAVAQCRKSLEEATAMKKKPASNNGGFIRYTVIPKVDAPRGPNSLLVGALAN